jgi:hypothetical protein
MERGDLGVPVMSEVAVDAIRAGYLDICYDLIAVVYRHGCQSSEMPVSPRFDALFAVPPILVPNNAGYDMRTQAHTSLGLRTLGSGMIRHVMSKPGRQTPGHRPPLQIPVVIRSAAAM